MATLNATRMDGLKLRASDVKQALTKRNPEAPASAIDDLGRLLTTLGEAVADLPRERQRALLYHPDATAALFRAAVAEMERRLGDAAKKHAETSIPVRLKPKHAETSRGRGLGERVDREEGRSRLASYATSPRLEDWAGPVAGPTELAAQHGISRSTLQDWRQAGAVIGLLKGTRKHVFPVQQFVDGRPLKGLAELLAIVGDPRDAWLWLVAPGEREPRTPLARLKKGDVTGVLEDARDAFA